MSEPKPLPRRFGKTVDPIALTCFFAREVAEEFEKICLGLFEGYFTGRAAPMGAVSPSVVQSTFYAFNPKITSKFTRFDVADPKTVLDARAAGTVRALERVISEASLDLDLPGLAKSLQVMIDACPVEGRALFSGYKAQAWPENPLEAVWHGVNALREFRGDGHMSILLQNGLIGIDAQVMHVGYAKTPNPKESFIVAGHGWRPPAFDAACERLAERGLTEPDGTLTQAGLELRIEIEAKTDELAAAPFVALGQEAAEDLRQALKPLSKAISASDILAMAG